MTAPKLPPPETYEQELRFMPYRKSLALVENIVCADAPYSASILDLMCGTGYLIGKIAEERPTSHLIGVDLNKKYVKFAKRNHPPEQFEVGDILTWQAVPFEVVLCTGALHHIPYEQQEQAIANIASLTNPKGFAIISDCYIDDYSNERERRLAAARLGYEYLRVTIANGAPSDVVNATADILRNDVAGLEFKTSVKKRLPVLQRHFGEVKTMKVWPNKQVGGYGDYVHVLRRARR